MTQPGGVLLDTSAWVAFFSPKGHKVLKSEVQDALDAERIHTCSVVVCELLVGARDRSAFAKLDELLNALPDAPIDRDVWKRAASLGFSLRKQGQSAPLSDLLIAESLPPAFAGAVAPGRSLRGHSRSDDVSSAEFPRLVVRGSWCAVRSSRFAVRSSRGGVRGVR